jgi:hypothetical protein
MIGPAFDSSIQFSSYNLKLCICENRRIEGLASVVSSGSGFCMTEHMRRSCGCRLFPVEPAINNDSSTRGAGDSIKTSTPAELFGRGPRPGVKRAQRAKPQDRDN